MEKKLRALIKEAMIQKKELGNANRYQTFKNILEKAKNLAIDAKSDTITDEMIIDSAKKEIKQLKDIMRYYKEGDAKFDELADCITCAEELLPKMATSEDITAYLESEGIEKNMGACMKALKAKFGNSLDGKMASGIVKEYISK